MSGEELVDEPRLDRSRRSTHLQQLFGVGVVGGGRWPFLSFSWCLSPTSWLTDNNGQRPLSPAVAPGDAALNTGARTTENISDWTEAVGGRGLALAVGADVNRKPEADVDAGRRRGGMGIRFSHVPL